MGCASRISSTPTPPQAAHLCIIENRTKGKKVRGNFAASNGPNDGQQRRVLVEATNNERIWQVVASIPAGKVCTYGTVAKLAGMSGAARRVGAALKGLPENTRIPWHRVINSSGRISLPAGSDSAQRQRDKLEDEGIEFKLSGAIDLRRFAWDPG
jgi:methylated-DNA-protein-cysteine methyltransferase related protein